MKNLILVFAVVSLLCSCDKTQKSDSEELPIPNNNISDDIQQTIADLYTSIGHNGEKKPDWKLFQSVFIEKAIMIDVKDTTQYRYTIEQYLEGYQSDIEAGNYSFITEYELAHTGDMYANIAQVFSTYAATIVPTKGDSLKKRGINSIQLMKDNGTWKITSIIWYDETDRYPIPAKYLDK